MVHWIAFDDETAETVVGRFKRGAAEIREGEPIDAALAEPGPSLMILAGTTPGRVLVACLEPKAPAKDLPLEYQPAGFLGLTDEPVSGRAAAKKKWWRRSA